MEREIACLRVLSSPNIARLVSAFRFRDGAYLVLEYASNGDLHTLVTENGSLSDGSARFVLGSVLAALASIHDAGFVFGDLKPENVFITEQGHVKVGDFGGCRAFTEEAKRLLKESTRAVSDLRDGDWREKSTPKSTVWKEEEKEEEEKGGGWGGEKKEEKDRDEEKTAMYVEGKEGKEGEENEEREEKEQQEEDDRVEGTAAYMAPETASGLAPTPSSDMWSLGCVLFLCIAGRPPLIAATEADTMKRIVRFAEEEGDMFGEERELFTERCAALVEACCAAAPSARPTCHQACSSPYFEGRNVHGLYLGSAPELGAGGVKKGDVDEQWTRRQHSSIWSPQPEKYTFGESAGGGGGGRSGENYARILNAPIVEGEEGEMTAEEKKDPRRQMLPPSTDSVQLGGISE